jgi:hypothetical protein
LGATSELGLAVEQVRNYGFAFTRLKPDTVTRYEEDIRQLAEVLIHRAKPVIVSGGTDTPTGKGDDTDDDKPSSRNRKATCGCPFIIRVSKSTLENTSIRCESCGEVFTLA